MSVTHRAVARPRIEKLARETFGWQSLRAGQLEAVQSLTRRRDTLVVMATGSGKSAIYQLAGCLIDGATLVVSPLISLQRDQIEGIEDELPGEAAALDASTSEAQREQRLDDLGDALEFLFLAPEQLAREETVSALGEADVSLLVVDEAHCISEWGHDFRPDYLRLGALVEALGRPTLLALTATASPPVRAEIAERLGMRDPELIVRGFDRPNLRLAVKNDRDPGRKRAALVERAAELGGPGIVYVATRRLTEELAAELRDAGLRTAPYHAGLARRARDETQAEFMDGRLDAVIATTAFGMGVDKPDVRFVLHHDPSDSLDSYWQEIGRAGRNGEPAEAMLFWREHDLGLRRFFAAGAVDGETVARVAERMANESRPVEPQRLREELELGDTKIASALSRLEEAGAVELRPDGRVRSLAVEPDQVERAMEAAEERRAFDRSRLEMMRAYAEHDRCRREFVLSYFGEPYEGPCGHCDNCEAGRGAAEDGAEPFVRGARVEHREWGEGVVQRYDGDEMSVLFDSVGYRTLSLQLVEERNLLRESS
ncbi:MAG TPA: RecQ family ATP-dependent DNA helicase [Thermoleophilaceae bacterium]|nr:RecQ family ATP-dependent DNA helicase [Thermoleophilaceae bacterium]